MLSTAVGKSRNHCSGERERALSLAQVVSTKVAIRYV